MAEKWRIKTCLVGDEGVGKTALVRRYVLDQFDDQYIATLGAKVVKKEITFKSTKTGKETTIILTIFDIMGSRTLREVLQDTYFTGVEGILAVCDITRPATLAGLKQWMEAVEKVAGKVPMVLMANKADLAGPATLTKEQVEAAAAGFQCPYFLTSAKTEQNVEHSIKALLVLIIRKAASGQAALELELPA